MTKLLLKIVEAECVRYPLFYLKMILHPILILPRDVKRVKGKPQKRSKKKGKYFKRGHLTKKGMLHMINHLVLVLIN